MTHDLCIVETPYCKSLDRLERVILFPRRTSMILMISVPFLQVGALLIKGVGLFNHTLDCSKKNKKM